MLDVKNVSQNQQPVTASGGFLFFKLAHKMHNEVCEKPQLQGNIANGLGAWRKTQGDETKSVVPAGNLVTM